MEEIKSLLIEELRSMLHAEQQVIQCLPAMAEAARHPKLQEAFRKHMVQTEMHLSRLRECCELLGEKGAEPLTCRGMQGLIEECKQTLAGVEGKDDDTVDLSLIAEMQQIEHYEIAAYGTARTYASQIGQREAATLLSQNLGEEESCDYLLTEIAKPLLQEAVTPSRGKKAPRTRHA